VLAASRAAILEVPIPSGRLNGRYRTGFGDLLDHPGEAEVAVRLDSLLLAGKSSGQRTGLPVIV
jgi:hypothetical protein